MVGLMLNVLIVELKKKENGKEYRYLNIMLFECMYINQMGMYGLMSIEF